MEEETPSRRSVAELAGRFKDSARPHDAAGNESQEKPVRRRPPRSLQLPKTLGHDQEPAGVTSPLPAKAKRNSALIEKLQANLALSPSALLPSPKSPGFRLLSPSFPPLSPVSSAPVTMVTTSSTATPTSPIAAVSPLTEEEGPSSFEAPPTTTEGSILSNDNIKGRARHSTRRRPPSRRHRKSSSGDEVGVAIEGGEVSLSSPTEPEDKTTAAGGGGEEGGETDGVKEAKTFTCPEENKSHEEDESKINVEPRREDEKEESMGGEEKEESMGGEEKEESMGGEEKEESMGGEEKEESMGGEEGDRSSSGRKEEEEEAQEKNSAEKQKQDSAEGATNTDLTEEENSKEH